MNRDKFLKQLTAALRALPTDERLSAIDYYTELLDDADDEEKAIAELPHPRCIAASLMVELGIEKKQSVSLVTIIFAVLSAPITIPLIATLIVLIITFLILMLAVAIVPFSLALSFFVSGIASLLLSVPAFMNSTATGLVFLGMTLVLAALCEVSVVLLLKYVKLAFVFIRRSMLKIIGKILPKKGVAK